MFEQVWRLQTDLITWERVDESVIVFDLRNSTYLSIDGSGIVVWESLSRGADMNELIGVVTDRFDVNADTARTDIGRFLAELARRGIAAPSNAPN